MSDKWKVFVVMTCAILLAAAGEALAAKGMKQDTQAGSVWAQIRAVFSDWHVIIGTLLMFGYVLLYVYALGMTELSFAVPLSAASYLFGTLLAKYYVHEDVKTGRWVGTAIIIAGVLVAGIFGSSSAGAK